MGSDTQSNEEQLEMLLMTLAEVRHGICLFQSDNQGKRVLLIQERFGKENIIVHDIAKDDEETGMVSSRDFRKWASETDAKVVIVYNLQLLGMRFGDEEAIEKLNFMRDQILSIGKLFVFGVSPYFNRLLSGKARDLYSCILYHFIFHDSEERPAVICGLDLDRLTGNDALEISRYMELKERIQSRNMARDIPMYLACMESWCDVEQYLSYREREFIAVLAEEADRYYAQKDIKIADIENVWILAGTWIGLENAERSAPWYEKVLCMVRGELGEDHELYADALMEYTDYYEAVSDYVTCEMFCDQAVKIYDEKNMKYSGKGRVALHQKAAVCCVQSKYVKALEIYQDLLNYQIGKFGENYYENASLYNGMARVYNEQGDLSGALSAYKRAIELLNNAGKQGGWLAEIYQNISVTYLESGDGNAAWKYIKQAKRIVEDVYGKESGCLIDIYDCMSGVWNVKEQPDKEFQYLQKALDLIRTLHMEESVKASFIYHNLGIVSIERGSIDDAIAFCKRAINIREKVYGEQNELTACSYEQLAYIMYKGSMDNEARKNINKARRIYVSLLGSQSERVKRIDDFLKSVK